MGTTTVDFGEVEAKLLAYVKATGAPMSKYLRRAVSEHIDSELANNSGTNERFNRAMAVLLAEAGGNVASLITKRRTRTPPGTKLEGSNEESKA